MMPYFSFDKIQIGPITLYVWGIFLALAFLVGFFLLWKQIKKQKIDTEIVINSFSWIIIGTIIGARLGYILQSPEYYFSQPLEILKIWEGGLTFHGGLFGLLLAVIIYARLAKVSRRLFFQVADLVALVLPISIAIGRIGCSLINDHQGAVTSLPWGIVWPDGAIRHPVAEYLIISALILFLILRFLKSRFKKFTPHRTCSGAGEGQLFFAFLFLYSFSRFFLDFTRATGTSLSEPRYYLGLPSYLFLGSGGLSTAQWLSLLIILGIIIEKLTRLNKIQRILGRRPI